MITVACVEHGNYLGRGRQYVDILRAAVKRNLKQPHRFVCLTDDRLRHDVCETVALMPGLRGWWNKCALFQPGKFDGRVLYIDLDSIITGPLDELVEHKGIIDLRTWGWDRAVYGSGVMVWDAGEHAEIWTELTVDTTRRFEGDQDWITSLGGWPALPAHMLRSYRYHCKAGIPEGCVIVSCHGTPKPHDITSGWVPDHWRV